MTENEIIKELESCYKTMSVYIGSSEECRKHNDAISKAIDAVKELQQYRSIGTVEECREAVERQRAKKHKIIKPCKSVNYYQCPVCDGLLHISENFCGNCGQDISWEEREGEDE